MRGATDGDASLLSRRATGGLISWEGLKFQTRYIALQVAHWLSDATFQWFTPENDEDVDVSFLEGGQTRVERHQVKSDRQTRGTVLKIVDAFEKRLPVLLADGSDTRLVIAAASYGNDIEALRKKQTRFLKTPNAENEEVQRQTDADFRSSVKRAGLEASAETFVKYVRLTRVSDVAESADRTLAQVVAMAVELPVFAEFAHDELRRAFKALVTEIEERGRFRWTRASTIEFLREEIEEQRAGPVRAGGDVLVLEHWTIARLPGPRAEDLSATDGKRVLRRTIDQTELFDHGRLLDPVRAATDLVAPDGVLLRSVREHAMAGIVYCGLPAIPLAALVGHLIQDQRTVQVVDYDRDERVFRWAEPGALGVPLAVETDGAIGQDVLVRISVSAQVDRTLCEQAIGNSASDISFALDTPHRGAIRSQEQTIAYAKTIRTTLDELVAGQADCRLHVFAAVPVSLAFLLGSLVSATSYPRTYVYNLESLPHPHYAWGLCLQDARVGESAVVRPSRS